MNFRGVKDSNFICGFCNQSFPWKGYSTSHRFCSTDCAHSNRVKTTRERNETLFDAGQLTSRPAIYQILVTRRGNKCEGCGIQDWMGKAIRFWVDHIDGCANNNAPSNLRLVCPNCDSQSDTFGGKNRGSGRKSLGLAPYS